MKEISTLLSELNYVLERLDKGQIQVEVSTDDLIGIDLHTILHFDVETTVICGNLNAFHLLTSLTCLLKFNLMELHNG